MIGPRVSVTYDISPDARIRFGYGLESQQEETSVYLARTTHGSEQNKDLRLSKAHHFVFSYKQHLKSDLIFQVEPYVQFLYGIPVVPGRYYSMLNNPGGYFNEPLVNAGEGRNYGVDVMLEHFLSTAFYYLVSVSAFRSRYKGDYEIWHNTRYDSRFVGNILGDKEWQLGKRLLGLNFKTSLTGGERYIPVNLKASRAQNREVLNEQSIYTMQLSWFFYLDGTITLRTNHKNYSGVRPLGIIPLLSYKLEF